MTAFEIVKKLIDLIDEDGDFEVSRIVEEDDEITIYTYESEDDMNNSELVVDIYDNLDEDELNFSLDDVDQDDVMSWIGEFVEDEMIEDESEVDYDELYEYLNDKFFDDEDTDVHYSRIVDGYYDDEDENIEDYGFSVGDSFEDLELDDEWKNDIPDDVMSDINSEYYTDF